MTDSWREGIMLAGKENPSWEEARSTTVNFSYRHVAWGGHGVKPKY